MPNRFDSISIEEKNKLLSDRLDNIKTELTEEQLSFVLHPIDKPCYLKACPGSGKTEVVGIKAAYHIKAWPHSFTGIAVLSFTRNAAKEISERIQKYGGPNATMHPHYIGTIDSWLHSFVLHPFSHGATGYKGKDGDKSYRIVDSHEEYAFLNPYKTDIYKNRQFQKSIWVNHYYIECGSVVKIQTQNRYLAMDKVEANDLANLKSKKIEFLKAGFTTYADAEYLCYYTLRKKENLLNLLVKRFPFIIIDECQDLSHNQLEILQLLVGKGMIVHFVGDNNQSIYEFKKVYTEKITDFIKNNGLYQRELTLNFRSNQKIVDVSLQLEQLNTGEQLRTIIGKEVQLIEDSCLIWEYEESEMPQLPQKFINFIKERNSNLKDDTISLNKSALLARSHSTLSEYRPQPNIDFKKLHLILNAIHTWNLKARNGKDMQNALQQLGKGISLLMFSGRGSHQHQYCPEGMTHVEWRNFLFTFISKASDQINELFPFGTVTWSKWCGNFKKFLEGNWSIIPEGAKEFNSIKATIRAQPGSAQKQVIDDLKQTGTTLSDPLRFTTIHDTKGETLDAVIVVSSLTNQGKATGRYYEDWIGKSGEKEHIRFAYVASSRPKHILIWAIPKIKSNINISQLQKLGFKISSPDELKID